MQVSECIAFGSQHEEMLKPDGLRVQRDRTDITDLLRDGKKGAGTPGNRRVRLNHPSSKEKNNAKAYPPRRALVSR